MPTHIDPLPLAGDPRLHYQVDDADRLTEVGGTWSDFADANAGSALAPESVVGRLLWDYVGDPTTRHLYRTMLKQVRQYSMPVRFRFRCDSPTLRRLCSMELTAQDGGHVRFGVQTVRLESRAAVPLLKAEHTVASGGFLTLCGWCQDVHLPGDRWVAVEEAVSALQLFEATAIPLVSHGICPTCNDRLMGMLDDADLSAGGSVTLGLW